MDKKELDQLIDKVNQRTATDEELLRYNSYLNQITSGNPQWDLKELGAEDLVKKELFERIEANMGKKAGGGAAIWPLLAFAASVIILLSIGSYFIFKPKPQLVAKNQLQHIVPGGNKAILTLSNGQQVSLTDAQNGKLAEQSNTAINKTSGGILQYSAGAKADTSMVYNTMTTPRGGKFTLILADGTLAVLDAASSIKYPVSFNRNERRVEITGQVYFEVAHNSAKPFRVTAKGQTIEDIGTHFNINAYDDEPVMKTTLIEGKIKISNALNSKIMIPGDQAVIEGNDKAITIHKTDAEESIAWKNGLFIFHQKNIQEVMRAASRWYDIEVEYRGNISSKKFGGIISRYKDITELLDNMKITAGIHYKIEGRRVILMN
jgi:ferric-dicitrate binding protein FerR (iron transport regulator)